MIVELVGVVGDDRCRRILSSDVIGVTARLHLNLAAYKLDVALRICCNFPLFAVLV